MSSVHWLTSVALLATSTVVPIQKAQELFQHRQFQQSLAAIRPGDPSPAAQFLRAQNLFMLDDLKEATEVLSALTKAEPNNSEFFDWLGKVYGRRAETSNPFSAAGYAGKAREAFEESVRLNSSNKDALSDLFDYYLEAPGIMGGGIDKAEDIAEKTSSVDKPEALFERARIAQKRKDFTEAESYYKQAIAAAPQSVGYPMALARLLSQQGRLEDSDSLAETCIKTHPDRPRALFAYANLLVKEKRRSERAEELLRKYLGASLTADDPDPDQAQKLLDQLKNGS